MDYLRVALFGSYLLRREDIREVMENFDRISEEPLFKMARMRASDDCQGLGDMISDPKAMENGADDFAQNGILCLARIFGCTLATSTSS